MKRILSILTIIIVFSVFTILTSCDDFDLSGCDCEEEIDDLVDDRGEPDDEEKTFENGIHTLTYWYHSDGFAQTFRWGEGTDLCCEITYSTIDNQAPVAQNQSVFTEVNIPVEITLTATDIDGDDLTYQVLNPPLRGSLSGTAPDLTYISNTEGNDSFTFKANDGKIDSLAATVTIEVTSSDNGGQEPPELEPLVPE